MKNLNQFIIIFLACFVIISVSCNSNYKISEKSPKLKYDMAQPQIRHNPKADLKHTYKNTPETTNHDNVKLEVATDNLKSNIPLNFIKNKTKITSEINDETIESQKIVEVLNQASNHQTEIVDTNSNKNNNYFWGLTGLIGLLTLGLGIPLIKKAKSMSLWASRNKKQSQTLLTLSHIGLGASGFYLGNQLAGEGILSSELTNQILFGTASIATALYPSRKKKTGLFKYSFFKAKMFSLFLALTGFALMMNVGNNWAENKHNSDSPVEVASNIDVPEHNDTIVVDNEPDRVVLRILGTIGVAIISIFLLYVIAVLSCMLACSSMGALAVVVFLGGLAGTIFLAIFLLKSIWKKKPKKDLSFSV